MTNKWKPILGNLINDRFPAHDPDVKTLFGLHPKAKWPSEGMPNREINGVQCWVKPLGPQIQSLRTGKLSRPFQLRAMCSCPNCGAVVSIGRLAQHEGTKTCTRRMK